MLELWECMNECIRFNVPQHITGNFGDKSFQPINCAGTDNQQQGNKTPRTPETQKRNTKTILANRTIHTLIWYKFYDLQPGNRVGPILTAQQPTQGPG